MIPHPCGATGGWYPRSCDECASCLYCAELVLVAEATSAGTPGYPEDVLCADCAAEPLD